MKIQEVMKLQRKALGITQQDLADMSEIAISTIKKIESGKGTPSLSTVEKIMDILGMEVKYEIRQQFNDPVSLTMPFREEPYQSDYLFPVFTNMLPEGANRKIVCRSWRLDEKDFFGLLLKIATFDTIGAITVKEVES